MLKVHDASQGRQSQEPPDRPKWTDHDLAVLLELAHSTGWHRARLGLPESDDALSFVERCRRRLAWLRTCHREGGGEGLWAGMPDDPIDLDGYRDLPRELRYLRRSRDGAA